MIGNSLKVLPSKTESNKEISIKPVIDFSIKREGNQYSMEQNLKSGQGLQIFTEKLLKGNYIKLDLMWNILRIFSIKILLSNR